MAFGLLIVLPGAVQAKSPPMTLAGPYLPFAVTVPFQQEARFWDRGEVDSLVPLQSEPREPAYTVSTWYWERALEVAGVTQHADDEALFYPAAGLVRVSRGDEAFFLALSDFRVQLLRNYLALARSRLIPAAPSVLDYVAGLRELGRGMALSVHGAPVSAELRDTLLVAAAGLSWRYEPVPELADNWGSSEIAELRFDLGGGEQVSVQYLATRGLLLDLTAVRRSLVPSNPAAVARPDERLVRVLDAISREAPPPDSPAAGAELRVLQEDGGRPSASMGIAIPLASLLCVSLLWGGLWQRRRSAG